MCGEQHCATSPANFQIRVVTLTFCKVCDGLCKGHGIHKIPERSTENQVFALPLPARTKLLQFTVDCRFLKCHGERSLADVSKFSMSYSRLKLANEQCPWPPV